MMPPWATGSNARAFHPNYDFTSSSDNGMLYSGAAGSNQNGQNISFDISFSATRNGIAYIPDLVFADPESTNPAFSESITVETNGGNWSNIENLEGTNYVVSGFGTNTVTITDTEAPQHAPLFLSKASTLLSVDIDYPTGTGHAGVTFGILSPYDLSDAPISFGEAAHFQIFEASAGPDMTNVSTHYMGAVVPDVEIIGNSIDAMGDDDDGVVLPNFSQGQSTFINVSVNGVGGFLQGWIDFDDNGTFDLVDRVATDVQDGGVNDFDGLVNGNIQIAVAVPSNASIGSTFSRFRWSTTTGLDTTTTAANGEVEDYMVAIGAGNTYPVAVDDSENTTEDVTVTTTDITSNDTDAESEILTVIDFTRASNGTVVNNGNATFDYTPNLSYTGSDSFDYLMIDTGSDLWHHWGLNGNGTDGVGASNGTINGTTIVAGKFGDALSFNESPSDYALVPDFSYNNEYTIAFDFKIDDNTGSLFQYIYSHGNINSVNSINIFLNEASHGTDPNQFRTVVRDSDDGIDNSALQFDASSFIGDGLWHTYTLIVNSSGSTVYVDGTQMAFTALYGGDSFNPTTSLYLGARDDLAANRYYGGSLDNVQVYGGPLSPGEIADQIIETNRGTVNILVSAIEICNNGTDDDGDGLIDSADPDCYDADGDGILDLSDVDDDNDGLLDTTEISCSSTSWHIAWNHGIDTEATIMVSDLILSGYDESYGPGLSGTTVFTLLQLSGITAITLSESIANQEYVEYSFTTQSSLSSEFFLSSIVQYETAPGNFNGHQLAVFCSNDGFVNFTELTKDITTIDGPQYESYDVSEKIYQFAESTTYSLRVYVYNIPSANSGQATLDDFSLNICSGDADADGVWNHMDLDSDNDGIFDVLEAGGEDLDLNGTIGSGVITDTDGDGWSDITDPDDGGVILTDPDADGNGNENRIDLDSDGDGCNDVIEAGFPDVDGDGQLGGIVPPTVDTKGKVTSGGL